MDILKNPSGAISCLSLGEGRCDRNSARRSRLAFMENTRMARSQLLKHSVDSFLEIFARIGVNNLRFMLVTQLCKVGGFLIGVNELPIDHLQSFVKDKSSLGFIQRLHRVSNLTSFVCALQRH